MIVLETERLLFRSHEPADLDIYCQMEADPDVRRWVGGAPRSRDVAERKFRGMSSRDPLSRLGLWATIYKPEQRYIGYCGVYPHFTPSGPVAGEGSLGYTLAKPYWGQGLATEAARAFVNFGFEELHLARIVSTVEVGNEASVRILKKLGFALVETESGERRSFFHFELTSLDRREIR